MAYRRLKLVLLTVVMWAAPVFAQSPKPNEIPDATTVLPRKHRTNSSARQKITLRLDDSTEVDPAILAKARSVATVIFRGSGLEAAWLEGSASETHCGKDGECPQFRLRIIPADLARGIVEGDALGFALPCAENEAACLIYIFYSRISALAKRHIVDPDLILGHVIAHEVGHTLIGPNAHDLYGIMQPVLPIADLGRTLFFTSAQTARLRFGLSERSRVPNR
jgi:hypothetical protein